MLHSTLPTTALSCPTFSSNALSCYSNLPKNSLCSDSCWIKGSTCSITISCCYFTTSMNSASMAALICSLSDWVLDEIWEGWDEQLAPEDVKQAVVALHTLLKTDFHALLRAIMDGISYPSLQAVLHTRMQPIVHATCQDNIQVVIHCVLQVENTL